MVIQWAKSSWNTLEDEGQGEWTFHDRYKDTKLIVTMPIYCWHSDGKQTIGINWQKSNSQNSTIGILQNNMNPTLGEKLG